MARARNMPEIAQLTLAIEQIGATGRVSDYELKLARSDVSQHMIYSLVRKVASFHGTETIELPEIVVPATWWDAFKERHFDVLLRWFPVRMQVLQRARTYRVDLMLPNVPLPEKHLYGAFGVATEVRP